MKCSKCEKNIDTDFNDFDFVNELCLDCWCKLQDELDLQQYRRLEDDNIPSN